jgi:hypothetical protein
MKPEIMQACLPAIAGLAGVRNLITQKKTTGFCKSSRAHGI